MQDKIIEALQALDVENDEHWTADGAPKLDALGIKDLKRQDVVKAAPHFSRTNPAFETPAAAEARKEAEVAERTKLSKLEAAAKAVDEAEKKVLACEQKRRDVLVELQKAIAERDEAALVLLQLQGGPKSTQHTIMEYLAAVQAEKMGAAQ